MASDRHQLRVIKRAMKGDAEAFARLCFRYSDALYRYLYFRLGSVLAAEEVCAEVFVRAWEILPTDARQTVLPFRSWLFYVANGVVVERNQRFTEAGMHPTRPPLVAWSRTSQNKDRPDLHPRFLAQAIMQLDEVSQQVIVLRFVIRLAHRDIGLVIGDTSTGSRVLQYRTLLELREKLTRKKMSENAYAIDYVGTATFCLDRIIIGRWSPEECLENLPQETDRLEQILQFAAMVREASTIRPRHTFGDELRKRLLSEMRQSGRRPVSQPRIWSLLLDVSERVAAPVVAAFLLGLILFAGVAGATGILTTVDAALPGDRLYDLDLSIERVYQALLGDPDARLRFALELTEERLREAEALASRGDLNDLQVALVAYSVEVASMTNVPASHEAQSVTVDLDAHFSQQQQRLDKLFVTALVTSSAANGEDTATVACYGQPDEEHPWHPIGHRLATQHGVDYGEVMQWVCDGHSFGEIVLALASLDSSRMPTTQLLQLRAELGGWGQLWHELQFRGELEE